MNRILLKKMFILAIFCILISMPVFAYAANVKASFIYSDDYFLNDEEHSKMLQSYFTTKGYSTNLETRPTIVYGLNQHLIHYKAVFLSSHGLQEGSKVVLKNGVYYGPDDITTDVGAEFVFVSACYSAKTNIHSNKNLCSTLIANGAKAAIGYEDTVYVSSSRYYENIFYQKFIGLGGNAAWAYVQAQTQTRDEYGSSDTVVTSVKFFGNGEYKY